MWDISDRICLLVNIENNLLVKERFGDMQVQQFSVML